MASKVLPPFNSQGLANSDSDSDIENGPPKKKVRVTLVWVKSDTFESGQEATEAVKSEKKWWIRRKYNSGEGVRALYDCKHSRSCPSKLQILFEAGSERAVIYRTEGDHQHKDVKINGLSDEIKEKIDDLIKSGVTKPKRILQLICESGLGEPEIGKVVNHLAYKKKRKG